MTLPNDVGLLVGLLVLAIPMIALAQRFRIAYPIVLVLAGLVLGFVPGLPPMRLDPDLVLLIFLPPLLYWEAITAPTDTMIDNAGQIGVLAVGLVIATTGAVAAVAHAIVPGLSWPVAFVLGAIVSPTDELASAPVLQRFRLPRHLIAIAEGESLLNDATALVLYASALVVATTHVFSARNSVLQFVWTVIGSIAAGLITGRFAVEMWRRIKDRQLQTVISLTVPFIAYLPAVHFGLSGVLAVVTAGVYANRFTPRVMTPSSRTQSVGFWNTVVFVANTVLFLIVGLQLHNVALAVFHEESWETAFGYALAVNVVIIIVRLALVVLAEYAPTAAPPDHAAPNWKNALVVAWSGLRGAVSLAAALAIPLNLPNGSLFPHRDLIVFITFTVILVTLVGGGLTLPAVLRLLRIEGGTEERDETRAALQRSAEAALTRVAELEDEGRLDAKHAEILRHQIEHKRGFGSDNPDDAEHARHDKEIEAEILAARRSAIIEMRDRGEIDNVVLRRVQLDLDLAAARPSFIENEPPAR